MNDFQYSILSACLDKAAIAYKKNEIPVAACIASSNEIISLCHNETTQSHNPCAHAEILAIEAATKQLGSTHLSGHSLYTTLEPCLMCYQAAKIARISHIYYIHNDENFGVFSQYHHLDLIKSHTHKLSASGPFPELDNTNLVKKFFNRKRTS